jgi:seryl-tRNA synthetase
VHNLADIRQNPDRFRDGLRRKGGAAALESLEQALALDAEHRRTLQEAEALRARQNAASKEIPGRKKAGEDVTALMDELRAVKEQERELRDALTGLETRLGAVLRVLPNLPDDDVPDGPDSSGNLELSTWGKAPEFDFQPKAHWDLGEALGILDPEAAGRMSGSGFTLLLGAGARLERALGQFLLDRATLDHGYREVSPPVLVRPATVDGVTMLEKFREDMYYVGGDDLFLIPTAEHPLTNLHGDCILDAARLPLRYTALTPCFRREAGAAGRDTRGMLRVHQFWKVEMMSFVHPDASREEHERMRGHAEAVLRALELPFRTVLVCTGDQSAANRRQYDLEVWAAGCARWLEVSSVSNFADWQSRRTGTRCRDGKDKPRHVHTLNGSALGMPRVLVALLENNQRADGSVVLPKALVPYMGGVEVLKPGRE